jgi:hypothetical protein
MVFIRTSLLLVASPSGLLTAPAGMKHKRFAPLARRLHRN